MLTKLNDVRCQEKWKCRATLIAKPYLEFGASCLSRMPSSHCAQPVGGSLAQHGPLMRVGEDDPKSSEEVGKAEIFK